MAKHLLSTPSLLASSTLVAWNALKSNGYDAHAIFLQAGLNPAKLKDQDARYSAKAVTRLHEVILKETGQPEFMLKLSTFWHPGHLNALGYGWLASSSLLEAFSRLVRYYDVASISGERVSLTQVGKDYLYRVSIPENMPPLHEAEEDSLMVVILAMCRISTGPEFKPTRLRMRRTEPNSPQAYHEHFGTRVEFDCEELAMFMPVQQIEAVLPTANTTLARACDRIIDEYLTRIDRADVVNQVRRKLVQLLPSGKVTEDDAAESLHLSIRSLQRKLQQEGITFRDLLDDTRRELARSYIRENHTSINEITYMLGYADPSNFTRAYKRWTGLTPSESRAANI